VFAKIAIGLVLFWGERLTRTRRLVLCVTAWLAVQAHSGALPFASAIFLYVLLLEWRAGARTAIVALVEIGLIVVALQIPSAFARQSVQPNKLLALLLHPEHVRPLDAFRALGAAVASIAAAPFDFPVVSLVLLGSAAALLVTKRLLTPIVAVTVVPLGFAVLFWSLWQGDAYEAYAFLTLVPPAGLLMLWTLRMLPDRAARSIAAVLLLVAAVAIQKPRIANAALVFRQPSYGALIRGTRALIAQGQTVRRVEAPFLPLTSDAEFVYTILGGKLSPDSTVVATLSENGEVSYAR